MNTPRLAPLDRSNLSPALRKLIDFFEHLTPKDVAQMDRYYTEQAYFKDPFNEVDSIKAIEHIFGGMFDQVDNPRFVVHTAIEQGDQAFIAWDFLFEMQRFKRGQTQVCRGSSHLKFAKDGRVAYHRDYWDTAEELYSKIPVLGGLMRWLRKQAA